ncbi:uncharacterized protein RSE6_02629 [Rhynchosporium secalis]|uniref:Uncharacterized protein n=1 Tax=Rhynchosporium secalis TaxID=38038 RepID=A0A1E1M0R6_RHYSE|nr:uncharacterized protein RSE6_02629 [Rhynchosporium secalis]
MKLKRIAQDRTSGDINNFSNFLPHPYPFASEDVEAAKAWLADLKNQDLSAWDHEKSYYSGIWAILEDLIADVVGIPVLMLREGIFAVCNEECGDQPTTTRLSHEKQKNIVRNYTRILRDQCKKEWNAKIEPWIAAALHTWANRAICLWKSKLRHNKLPVTDQPPRHRVGSDARERIYTPEGETGMSRAACHTVIQMRPVCEEYNEFVNFVVRNAEVNGNPSLELQPTWPGYDKDPFDITARMFRRAVKDRMIEDGIMKQCNRIGAFRAPSGVQLDHSVSYQDYPLTKRCRWVQDYFSEGYSVGVRIRIGKVIDHCQSKSQGPYVPPARCLGIFPVQRTTNDLSNLSRLDLVIRAPLDCGEYLDFINKVVRIALHYTYPQTVYEIDFPLGSDGFGHQRAEQLVGRVFRRMVKDNILEHTGNSVLGRYDLCPSLEAKRFYLRRKLHSSDAGFRLDTSNEQSLLRLQGFLDTNIDSICQEDLIRLYGSDAGSRYDELQAEFMPKIKYEVIEDDLPITVPIMETRSTETPTVMEAKWRSYPDGTVIVEKATALWVASHCKSRQATSSFGTLSSSKVSLSGRPSYPSQEDMPSPRSGMAFSDDNLPGLASKGDEKPNIYVRQPFDVKEISQSKMKELAWKRELEREASQGERPASKRQHC